MAEKTLKFVLLGEDKASGVVKHFEGAIIDLNREIRKSTREVSIWRRGIDRVRTGMKGVTGLIFSLRGALLALGLGYVAKQTVEVANSFEQYRMTLQVLEKGIDAGNKKFQELLEFATQTPYRINEVMEAYKTLKAYGLDPTIETMTALGDTAAAMGKEVLPRLAYAFGQMAATGKVMAQDLMQLSNAGVNVGDALRSGFNIGRAELEKLNEAIAAGVVDMQDVIDVFMGYMRDQFGGMMQRQMSTLGGQIEELRSYWQLFQDTLMKQGAYNEVTAFLTALNDRIQELQREGKLDEWALRVGEAIVGAMEASAKAIGITIDSVRILKDSLTVIVKTMALFFALVSRDKDVIKEATEDLKNYVKEIGKRKSAYEEIKKELEGLEGKMEEVKLDARIRETASSIVADIRDIRKETRGLVADLSGVGEAGREELGKLEKAAESIVEDIRGVYGEMEKQAEAVWKATRTPLERYQEEVKKLNKLLEAGMISQETYVRGITSAWERYGEKVREVNEEIKKSGGEVEEVYLSVWYEIRQNIADFLDQAMQGFASFRDFANSVWVAIRRSLSSALAEMLTDWLKSMRSMAGGARGLLGTLGTAAYGIAGMVRGEPWRAVGGVGAAAAMFTGHPMIATATIVSAEIARAIFKGRVEWVGVGAGAAGIPTVPVGMEKTWWGLGFGMGWLEEISDVLFGWLGGIFSRKWPTLRGTAELSLKGLSDSLDYVEGYMREIEKYLDEHTEIYAMYKTKFARITIMEKRDVKGSMDEITQAFGSFVDDLVDFYQSILPSTMRFEELPSIKMTFGAGKKNMENLAKQFVNELVSQTYNAWAVPIIEEYNRLLGMDLFEKFGLPRIEELVGGIGHRWNEQMKKLYERLSREVLPSLGVAFTYAKTIMNLVDKYGEGLVNVYKDEIANELVNMLERYKGEVQGLKEEEVKKKAEEFGQTVNEYLSTVVSIIGEIEDIIAQYTLSSFEQNLREIRSWYQEKLAELTSLGLSTERLLLAVTLKIKNLIEQSVIAPLKSLYSSIQQFRLPEPAFISWQVTQLETKWGLIWGDIDALAGRWDELIADASTYFSLLQRQFEFEAQAIRARAEERKAQIRAEVEAQRAVMQERLNGIQEETSALREQKRELESIKEQWKGVIDSIKQRLQELQFGPEAPVQSWAAYQVKWAELVEAARTSPEAAQELIEFSKRYLEVAKIYAPSQYLDIWQQVVSTLQDVQDNAVSEIDLLQTQIDVMERQTEVLENRARDIERSMNNIGSDLSARLAAIDAQAEQQITLLRQEYANRMMAIHDRLREVGEYLAKQIEEQMPEDIRLLTATANWLEKIYNYLTGVPSAQTGGVTTREGLYHLHAGETILPRNTNIKVEIDSDKLGKSIASSLLSAGVTSGSGSQSIHLHIDGREIATVTAEQMRRGHSELIKQVRRVSH